MKAHHHGLHKPPAPPHNITPNRSHAATTLENGKVGVGNQRTVMNFHYINSGVNEPPIKGVSQ
jgi:hypothetical protein